MKMTDAVKATLDEFLNDDAKLSELVTETFPNAGGKALVKDIQPNLKQYIDQHDSGAVSEEKRDALRTKFFASRLEEELDEAGYKQFLKDLLTEIKEAL